MCLKMHAILDGYTIQLTWLLIYAKVNNFRQSEMQIMLHKVINRLD